MDACAKHSLWPVKLSIFILYPCSCSRTEKRFCGFFSLFSHPIMVLWSAPQLFSDLLNCNFERDNCEQYFRIASPGQYGATIRWTRNRGPTPTQLTGPDADHTRGDMNGKHENVTIHTDGLYHKEEVWLLKRPACGIDRAAPASKWGYLSHICLFVVTLQLQITSVATALGFAPIPVSFRGEN